MKVDLLDSRFGIVVPFLSMRSFLLECGCATFHSEVKRLVLSACHWCRPKYWPLAECPGLRWPQCVGGSPTRVSSPVSAFGLSALRIIGLSLLFSVPSINQWDPENMAQPPRTSPIHPGAPSSALIGSLGTVLPYLHTEAGLKACCKDGPYFRVCSRCVTVRDSQASA